MGKSVGAVKNVRWKHSREKADTADSYKSQNYRKNEAGQDLWRCPAQLLLKAGVFPS